MAKMYRQDIDSIKGISIIAVVLFHLGLLKSGYLGVDAFFVINGFFVIPSVVKSIASGDFSYRDYITKRTMRLYPLILCATAVCLLVGYIGMLPDNYENIGQAVVASNFMSENILSAVTTHDYWNVANDYNPLMHLWYVGILFEFYVILPVLLWIPKKLFIRQDSIRVIKPTLYILTLLSFVLYVLPFHSNKFYFLQYRFFELGIGGILALNYDKIKGFVANNKAIYLGSACLLVFFIFSSLISQDYNSLGCQPLIITNDDTALIPDGMLMPRMILLLCTVSLTCVCLANPIGGGRLFN